MVYRCSSKSLIHNELITNSNLVRSIKYQTMQLKLPKMPIANANLQKVKFRLLQSSGAVERFGDADAK